MYLGGVRQDSLARRAWSPSVRAAQSLLFRVSLTDINITSSLF